MPKVSLELIQGNSYYIKGIFAIGIYRYGTKVMLIDSGSDEQSAKDVADVLAAENYIVGAIINTHCHPDHCGGNSFFQKKYPEIKIYAAYDEKMFIEDPKWAPRCFCGNAAPFSGLKNKHIAPQKSSIVTDIIPYCDGTVIADGQSITIVTLPGHTPGSIGVITPDNILYSGDALFGKVTFIKHPILFYTDIENTLASFKKLAVLRVDACVLYHGGIIDNLVQVVQEHEQRVLETKDAILSIVQHAEFSLDILTQEIMQKYNIPGNVISFTLTQTTIRAYLTKLESEGAVNIEVKKGLLRIVASK